MSPPSDSLPTPPDSPLRNRSLQACPDAASGLHQRQRLQVAVGLLRHGDRTDRQRHRPRPGAACFTIPYLLLAPFSGSLADRYSKRVVIVACKVAEVVIMALAILGARPREPDVPLLPGFPDRGSECPVCPLQVRGDSRDAPALPCSRPERVDGAGHGVRVGAGDDRRLFALRHGHSEPGRGTQPWELWPVVVA